MVLFSLCYGAFGLGTGSERVLDGDIYQVKMGSNIG
jgi:hypothetical protein